MESLLIHEYSIIDLVRRAKFYSRILFVDLEQFPISLSFLTELQNSKADINSFIVLFAKFILNNKDFDTECIKLSAKYRDKLLHDTDYAGMYRRYYSMYGWFAAIWDMYIKFLHQYGICTEFDFYTEMKAYIYTHSIVCMTTIL